MQRLLTRRPFMSQDQKPAEASFRRFPDLVDALDSVFGRSNDRAALLCHAIDIHLFTRLSRILLELDARGEGIDEIFLDPPVGALANVVESFLARLREMDREDKAPVLAVDRLAVLGRGLFRNLPALRQNLDAALSE